MTQLVEELILTPEVCSLSPVIGNLYIANILTINGIEKTKIKKKTPEMAHLKNAQDYYSWSI